MIVYLVRHGLSAANMANLVTGTPKDKLVDKGELQAEALRLWLSETKISPSAFYVSHWGRARQTAQILYPDAAWQEDPRLGETNAGTVADLSLSAFLKTYPDFYTSNANCYPGGESHQQLNIRVLSFWREICKLDVPSVLLVTHSGPISCILQQTLGVEMARFPAFVPIQASISILEACSTPSVKRLFKLKGFSLGPVANITKGVVGCHKR